MVLILVGSGDVDFRCMGLCYRIYFIFGSM